MSLNRISRSTILFLSLSTTSALAGQGFYIGAGGLFTEIESKMKYTSIESAISTETVKFDESADKGTGGGQINGGYQWLFPLTMGVASLAVEVAGEFQSAELKTSIQSPTQTRPTSLQMTFDSSAVLSLKPGFFITNNLLVFGEVGVVYSQITDIKSEAGAVPEPAPVGSFPFGDYGNKNLAGLRGGAGINYLLTKSLSLEAAWRYTGYFENFDGEERKVIATTFEKVEITDIRTQQAFLGFHYYFN